MISRVLVLGLTLSFASASALPQGCAKILGDGGSSQPADPPPPPPVPVTSATAPPIWAPPDPGGPLPTPTSTTSAPAAPSPDLAKAKTHAGAGEHKKVRAILEKKVKAGKANTEEAALLASSCIALKDRACLELIKSKHPEVDLSGAL